MKAVLFRASISVRICQREYVTGTTEYEDEQRQEIGKE
jgi:hypothetical protein